MTYEHLSRTRLILDRTRSGLDRYAYANNNPINQSDPDGLLSISSAWNSAKAAAAAAYAKWRAIQRAIAARIAALKAAAIARAKAAAAAAAAAVAAAAARAKAAVTARAKATAKRVVAAAVKVHTKAHKINTKVNNKIASAAKSAKKAYNSPSAKQAREWNANCGGEGGACIATQIAYNSRDSAGNRITPTDSEVKSYNDAVIFAVTSLPIPGLFGAGLATKGVGLATKGTKAADIVSDAAKTAATACSFAGPTIVLMADGTRERIDQVTPGDMVVATDPETGEQEGRPVSEVFVHDDTLYDLTLADGTVLSTTEDHPFWSVSDRQFERADQLSRGEQVLAADGRQVKALGLDRSTAQRAVAYNLSVEGVHTFHVGRSELLVHNTCPLKPVNLPAWKRVSIDMDHISSGHMAGGSRLSTRKDLFPDSMNGSQVESAVRQAYRTSTRVSTQGERVQTRGVGGGLKIEMWVNRTTRTIETAYPVGSP